MTTMTPAAEMPLALPSFEEPGPSYRVYGGSNLEVDTAELQRSALVLQQALINLDAAAVALRATEMATAGTALRAAAVNSLAYLTTSLVDLTGIDVAYLEGDLAARQLRARMLRATVEGQIETLRQSVSALRHRLEEGRSGLSTTAQDYLMAENEAALLFQAPPGVLSHLTGFLAGNESPYRFTTSGGPGDALLDLGGFGLILYGDGDIRTGAYRATRDFSSAVMGLPSLIAGERPAEAWTSLSPTQQLAAAGGRYLENMQETLRFLDPVTPFRAGAGTGEDYLVTMLLEGAGEHVAHGADLLGGLLPPLGGKAGAAAGARLGATFGPGGAFGGAVLGGILGIAGRYVGKAGGRRLEERLEQWIVHTAASDARDLKLSPAGRAFSTGALTHFRERDGALASDLMCLPVDAQRQTVALLSPPSTASVEPPTSLAEAVGAMGEIKPFHGGAEDYGVSRVTTSHLPEGRTSHLVHIPGTESWDFGGKHPHDMLSNTMGVAGARTALQHQTMMALEHAGAQPGDEIVLVGYSGGGIAAANLAADPLVNAKYDIAAAVLIGAPGGNAAIPADTMVLSLEHAQDPVPGLAGRPLSPAPNHATIVVDSEGPGHGRTELHLSPSYAHLAEQLDSAGVPEYRRMEHQMGKVLGWHAEGTTYSTHDFTSVRR